MWLSQWQGPALPGRVTGSGLIPLVCKAAAQQNISVFFLGSTSERLDRAKQALCDAFEGLNVCGKHAPPFGFMDDRAAQEEACAAVNAADPDIVFVALGAPRQEIWSQRYRDQLKCGVLMSIGAGLDFYAGDISRAPKWMQDLGLEWTWRIWTEPRRLGPRYLRLILRIPCLLMGHVKTR